MEFKRNIAVRFLLFIVKGLHSFTLNEGYAGDIEEEFHYRCKKSGKIWSFFWLLKQTIKSVPGSILFNLYTGGSMLKNYIKTAFRNIKRQKAFALINVIGLATGLACCLLIFFYVSFEYSYNNYHDDVDRIYRITNYIKLGENEMNGVTAPYLMAQTLMDEFPEIEIATKFYMNNNLIKNGKFVVKESVTYADSNYLKIFALNLLEGNKKDALSSLNKIIISKKISEKLFGNENPLGKSILIDNEKLYKVAGLFDEVPHNSDYRFELLASMPPVTDPEELSWLAYSYRTFFKFKEKADHLAFEPKLSALVDKYMGPELENLFGTPFSEFKKNGNQAGFAIQPITDIHMNPSVSSSTTRNSEEETIFIISSIGLFILLLACINYINLSTAYSMMRSREIGVRKVLGSARRQLVIQFLTESIIVTAISLLIAVGIVELFLPKFNELIGENISTFYFNTGFGLVVLFVVIFVGILAGFYPSLLLSGFKPVDILRNKISNRSSKGFVRKALVIFQFVTSIALITGTFVVNNQLNFIQNKKLGYEKEQVLVLNGTGYLKDNIQAFTDECKKITGIKNATVSGFLPVTSSTRELGVFIDGNYSENDMKTINAWDIDYNYFETMGIKIKDGRNFNIDFSTDTSAVIVNEALAKYFGWEKPFDHQIGKAINFQPFKVKNFTIVGVVEDFHFKSLRQQIAPLIFFLRENKNHISFKINSADVSAIIASLQKKWDAFNTGHPFSYEFLDETFSSMYKSEARTGKVFGIFSFLALLIACLGLFGLSSFTAQRKTKEIGIRKVHGAEIKDIVILLTREFVIYVLLAFIISIPLSYYFMDKWLQDFAYRSEMGAIVFISSGLIALAIAAATVSYHAIVAALLNPAKTLKYE